MGGTVTTGPEFDHQHPISPLPPAPALPNPDAFRHLVPVSVRVSSGKNRSASVHPPLALPSPNSGLPTNSLAGRRGSARDTPQLDARSTHSWPRAEARPPPRSVSFCGTDNHLTRHAGWAPATFHAQVSLRILVRFDHRFETMSPVGRRGTRRRRSIADKRRCPIFWSTKAQPELAMKVTHSLALLQQDHVVPELANTVWGHIFIIDISAGLVDRPRPWLVRYSSRWFNRRHERSGHLFQGRFDALALRVGRELFAFLPVEMVVVDVQANLLNTRTGHQGIETILSVAMSRAVFAALNFERLDPSDAMENFPHRMNFRKAAGFDPVEPFSDQELFRFQDTERPPRMLGMENVTADGVDGRFAENDAGTRSGRNGEEAEIFPGARSHAAPGHRADAAKLGADGLAVGVAQQEEGVGFGIGVEFGDELGKEDVAAGFALVDGAGEEAGGQAGFADTGSGFRHTRSFVARLFPAAHRDRDAADGVVTAHLSVWQAAVARSRRSARCHRDCGD